MSLLTRLVSWKQCWRVIPTRYPSENLFSRVAATDDLPALQELDELTSTRRRQERGEINFLPLGEQVTGPGSQYIMASFCYSLLNKSRFSDGSYGVYYGALTLRTSVEETRHHREEFMRATAEEPMLLSMRAVVAVLKGELHDIRGLKSKLSHVYSPTSYTQSQAFARKLWDQGSKGIVYDSVRHPKGECAAVFRPSILSHCREDRQLVYEWDGKKISTIYELQEFLKVQK